MQLNWGKQHLNNLAEQKHNPFWMEGRMGYGKFESFHFSTVPKR
jgi:hypothetical protein